ncbi:Cyclic AMP-dependent transcription factor ATF-6 beta [Eumeta japonica]|uniref:Cyclic AMP-dependent transcription factor ATF-6 beta n=1 Tax=Eumeta variegata TaxID=151549 RepID=A0A4C1YB54_EUMVA|nr:Cyclic AMP-dependent transcription factor ATF-6 beta [Eumeta japonica]
MHERAVCQKPSVCRRPSNPCDVGVRVAGDDVVEQSLNNNETKSDCKNTNPDNSININQTESIRITGELNRWIGSGKTLNWTYNNPKRRRKDFLRDNKIDSGDIVDPFRLFSKLNTDNNFLDDMASFPRNIRDKTRLRKLRRQRDMDFNDNPMVDYQTIYPKTINNIRGGFDVTNDFGAWDPLLEALQRRDDTFYIVGVGKGEHLLLPAVSHNYTRPPKMALILPAKSGNDSLMSDDVTLMQIDCSVVNTTLVKLKTDALPENARKRSKVSLTKNLKLKQRSGKRNILTRKRNKEDSVDGSLLDILYNSSKNISNNQIKHDKITHKVMQEVKEDYFVQKFSELKKFGKDGLLAEFPKTEPHYNKDSIKNIIEKVNGAA